MVRPKEAKKLIDEEKYVFVDVRTEEEFKTGHAPGAVNIPVMLRPGDKLEDNPDFLEQVKAKFPKKDQPLVLCDQHGRRGELAAEKLEEAGYTNLRAIQGGMEAWKKAELPLEE